MFSAIKKKVQERFAQMAKHELFVVSFEKNELFEAYLAALPDEYRQEHRCNCCRSFINQYGSIVAIDGRGRVMTLWDFTVDGTIYEKVPSTLHDLIENKVIEKPFLSPFAKLGTDSNRALLPNGDVTRWEHFYVELPRDKVTRSDKSIDSLVGEQVTTKDVFQRGLETITLDAAETVLGLIRDNALYRGKEYEKGVASFVKNLREYSKLNSDAARSLYAWANFKDAGARVRNTAIGTLLIDLSEGKDLDRAVRAYEVVVAPANYKRPTALVTEKMVASARDTIETLGLTASLKRRHATALDIPLEHLLFVNRTGAANVGSVFDSMAAEAPVNPKSFARAREVTVEEFVTNILPGATAVKLLLENGHNFVSLIAPEDPDAKTMFAWNNGISWTYEDNNADALKQKVSKAGGKVDGELRISLEWFNHDDLDVHVIEPGGFRICYMSKKSPYSQGFLDVDMNAGYGTTREPVENIAFERSRIKEGEYKVIVKNYSKRENKDFGFNIEVESQGTIINLNHPNAVPDNKEVTVATFTYSKDRGITNFKSGLSEKVSQREVNGVLTNRFQDVKMVMFSPNHWDGEVGNKHLCFILDKARIDTPLRPFFNEYLHPSLNEHRKVFEILGNKLMVQPSDDQLTGIGFSLTQRFQPVVKVNETVYRITI